MVANGRVRCTPRATRVPNRAAQRLRSRAERVGPGPTSSAVARTAPAAGLLEGQAWSPRIAIRRRADGGYTVAHGSSSLHSLTPATFRFAAKFIPAFRQGHE